MSATSTTCRLPTEDVTADGRGTKHWILSAEQFPALSVHRITRCGLTWATPGYRRVRVRPSGSYLTTVCEGQGRALVDGEWQVLKPNMACLAPPRVPTMFEAVPGTGVWVQAWIRYEEPEDDRCLVRESVVRVEPCVSQEFRRILEGMRAEWDGRRDHAILRLWLELLHSCARRLAQPKPPADELIERRWRQVMQQLNQPWTLEKLAAHFGTSKERLRQVCLRQFGRSPMEHLTYLRIEKAQELLLAADDKVDAVATEVGYESGLVFARAFRRWTGCTPTEFRRR